MAASDPRMAMVYQSATPLAHANTSFLTTWILPTKKTPQTQAKTKTKARMPACCDRVERHVID